MSTTGLINKKNLAFTIAFGDQKYMRMAKALQKCFGKYSPQLEFKIFTDGDFTPYNLGLPKDRKLYKKDYKYPKIEIMSRLCEENTRYMYFDADSFIFDDVSCYFNLIEPEQLIIEYVNNGSNGWAGNKKFQLPDVCNKVGIGGILPYSINSGFILWEGYQSCFAKALELIKKYTFDDPKGRKGDEYYLCTAMQLENTKVFPLDYTIVKLGKFWNGDLDLYKKRLICDAYPDDACIITHYGHKNYDNPYVKKIMRDYGVIGYDIRGWFRYKKSQFFKICKKFILKIISILNRY